MGGKHSTNVSNAFTKDIFARVSDTNEDILKEHNESEYQGGLKFKFGADVDRKREKETEYDPHRRDFDEFTKIAPRKTFCFFYERSQFVYITIFTKSESSIETITKNLKIPPKTNVIVDESGYLHYAKHGKLWIENSGKDHKKKNKM